MERTQKKLLKQRGRQILSFVLIAILLLGLIPVDAYVTEATGTSIAVEKQYTVAGYTITYKETSSWGNFVSADVIIQNNTDESKDFWEIEFSYQGTIQNIWNADIVSSENGQYVIAAKSYNSTINSGQSVSFGFTAYGEERKPEIPEQIVLGGETADNSEQEDNFAEQNTSDASEETQPGEVAIPENWTGLEYALFSSGEEDIALYAASTDIIGSVHSNQNFCYQGSELKVDGVLEATGRVTLETANDKDALQVTSQIENAEKLVMPDITEDVYTYVAGNGTIYEGNGDFSSENIVIDAPLGIAGDAQFNATSFCGKGIVYAEKEITFNVGELATPEDSRVFIMSKNGNITLNGSDMTLNAVLYAPNGCVTINTARLNLNGRIIAKKINVNASEINVNAGPDDYEMLDFLLKPELDIVAEGNQKVNRKVTMFIDDLSESAQTVLEDAVWSITKEGKDATDCCVVDVEHSDAFRKEMLFKEAGTYKITAVVQTANSECVITKELTVVEDTAPAACFTLESNMYRCNEDANAVVHISDASSLPDGDSIGQRIWMVYYDANNDGIYEETECTVVSEENETEITYETQETGNYKVVLEIVETFENTIPALLEEGAYLKDDTLDMVEKDCVFRVEKETSLANIDVEKSKLVDIVFTVGDVDQDTQNVYVEKAKVLKNELAERGIDSNVDIASTSFLTAKDTFAWKEYDHIYTVGYPLREEKHIIYEENSITMMGYINYPRKDFIYIEDDNPGQKIFEFDLEKDNTDWHSIEGGGFLFNTTIDDEGNTIKGFCILFTIEGLKLVQLDCNNLTGLRDGKYNLLQSAGALLKIFPIENIYDKHHFKVVTDDKSISVWDGEKLVIDNYILPENDFGYGYGLITSNANHLCEQKSYFTFGNITMETINGSSLSDIVEGYDWRPGASHYVVNLSDTEVPELSTGENTADLAAALIKNDATFIGIGNEINENQYRSLLNVIETGGMYLPSEGIADTMDEVNEYITDDVMAKDCGIGDYITTDDTVTYKGYALDEESYEIYEQQWEYTYNPILSGGGQGETEHIIRSEKEPITIFEKSGSYDVRLRIHEKSTKTDDSMGTYRKWSGTELYEKRLTVYQRPTAEVVVEISEDATDSTSCIANATYSAEALDHPTTEKQGIREEFFWYKNITDGAWTEGTLPNKLIVGETYLVKYQVTDMKGISSFPAVAVVKTGDRPVEGSQDEKLSEEEKIILQEAKSKAVAWLKAQADENDSWSKDGLMNTTCDVLAVLRSAGETVNSPALDDWLAKKTDLNVDEQCHAILGKPDADAMNQIWEQQNADGGFGLTDEYTSDVYDTLLVLMAESHMQEQGYPAVDSAKIQQALYYIATHRNADGGFGYNKNDVSRAVLTAEYAILLDRWQVGIISDNSLMSFCEKQYTGDFSENTFMEQCMLARYLQQTKASGWTTDEFNKVIATQQENGSIYGDIRDTMLYIVLLDERMKEGE